MIGSFSSGAAPADEIDSCSDSAVRLPRPYSGPSAMLRPVLAAVLIVAPNLVTLPRRFARTTPLSELSSVQVGMARDLLGICGAGPACSTGPRSKPRMCTTPG